MKERLLTFILALGALAFLYALMIPKPVPSDARASEPLSTDAGPDGELAIWRWLQAENIPVSSLRLRFDRLDGNNRGNVLISVMPHRVPLRQDEWQPLYRWLESGNTLIILAALDDTPRWTLGQTDRFQEDLQSFTDIHFQVRKEEKKDSGETENEGQTIRNSLKQLVADPDISIEPRGSHALLAHVHSVHGISEFPASRWIAIPQHSTQTLGLLQRADTHDPMLWIERRGEGQIVTFALATPFSNGQIAKGDNAQLLSNIIAWSRAPNGSVIFDDAHQGLTAYYDQKAFFADPRLHRTVWWLLFLWLAFVLGPLPLRSAYKAWKPVDETALIEASGRFYSAAVSSLDAAHRLYENFFNQLRRKLNLPQNGEPLWDWLRAQSSVPTQQYLLLQRQYARVYAGERVKLSELQNLLTDIRGRVA